MNKVWPKITAPPKYDNPHPDWEDPALPDFGLIFSVARECGYSIGLHGSMKRDVDLMAVPWTDQAVHYSKLIERLCKKLNAKQIGDREEKPHGRIAVNLQIDGFYKLIDLSIMPLFNSQKPNQSNC